MKIDATAEDVSPLTLAAREPSSTLI